MSVLDDIRNYYSTNIQPFLSGGPEKGPSVITPKLLPREKLANTNIINVREPALPQQVVSPGVVSDFNFSSQTGSPVNEFAPVQGQTNLDRVRAGQTDTDSKSLFDLIGRDSDADKYLALALGGFSMAEAAGKPGATFLSSLGTGGKTGVAGAISARAAARKADTAETLARAKLAAAKAKGIGKTSPEAKLVRDLTGFAIGTSAHQAALKEYLEEKASGEGKPAADIQKARAIYPNDLEKQRKYLERLPIMGNKGALAAERMKEIEIDPDFNKRTSPRYNSLQTEHKRQKLLFEAANADVPNTTRINQLENKIRNQTAQLLNKQQTPAREALIKQDISAIEKGVGAIKVFAPLNLQDNILLSGKVRTGAGQGALDTIAALMTTVGVEDPNKLLTMVGLPRSDVALGQVSTAQKNTVVGNILSGKAFGNNPSNADLKFIENMVAQLNLEPEANAKINQRIFEQYEQIATKSIRAQKRLETRAGIKVPQTQRETAFMQKSLKQARDTRKRAFGILSQEVSEWMRTNGGGVAANSPAYKENIRAALNILKQSDRIEDVELVRRLKTHAALTTGAFNRVGAQ